MDSQLLQKEIMHLLFLMGIIPKEIRIITDTELFFTIISLRLGKDRELLRENNNEGLRAVSTIFPAFLQKQHHYYKDLIFDLDGEEIKLINHTKEKAAIAMERVEFFDKPYEFGYLNAYERMLIHRYLKKYPHIQTESLGEGKERRLHIQKKTNS